MVAHRARRGPRFRRSNNAAWPKNPIDNFILAELEKQGLAPAAEADRRTLARRLSLDLTGLPPAPELVEAFVNDKDPAAYENLVDKLLRIANPGASIGLATGSMRPAMPTRTAFTSTITARTGRIAIG